jgi:hypothetical protein
MELGPPQLPLTGAVIQVMPKVQCISLQYMWLEQVAKNLKGCLNVLFPYLIYTKIWQEQPMSDHLSTQGRPDPREGLDPNKTWTFSIGTPCIWCIKNRQKWIRIEKVKPPKLKTSRTQKKQTTKHYKAHSKSLKKFLVCCSIVIRVLRWFVELKVVLL